MMGGNNWDLMIGCVLGQSYPKHCDIWSWRWFGEVISAWLSQARELRKADRDRFAVMNVESM